MSYTNETYKRLPLHDVESIQSDLNNPSFFNVCILQRHAWLFERELLEKATDAVEEIKKQVIGEPSDNLIPKDSSNLLKELFLVISMFGPDGADCYKFFVTNTRYQIIEDNTKCEKICNLVFNPKNYDQLKIIQSFSQKYEGYDALSLITFENIDYFIYTLKEYHDIFKVQIAKEEDLLKQKEDLLKKKELVEMLLKPSIYEELLTTKKNPKKLKIIEEYPQIEKFMEVAKTRSLYKEELGKLINHLRENSEFAEENTYSSFFPMIYHESMYHEKESLLKIEKIGEKQFIELPFRVTYIVSDESINYSLNLERYCYDILRSIDAHMKIKYHLSLLCKLENIERIFTETDECPIDFIDNYSYPSEFEYLNYNEFNLFRFLGLPDDTPIIKKLKKKYAPKSKTRFKQPIDYFFKFCGIKVWDSVNIKSMKKSKAVDAFFVWFDDIYPNSEDALSSDTIIKNYNMIRGRIKNKKLFKR